MLFNFINKNFDSESNRNITMLFKIQKLEKNYLSFGACTEYVTFNNFKTQTLSNDKINRTTEK